MNNKLGYADFTYVQILWKEWTQKFKIEDTEVVELIDSNGKRSILIKEKKI